MHSTRNRRRLDSWSSRRTLTTCSQSKTIKKRWPAISKPSTGSPFPPQHHTLDKAHGRIEERTIRTTTALNGFLNFPHVGQSCLIERHTFFPKTGKQRTDLAYCITDLDPASASPSWLLELNRGHWSIENRLHWVRDVTFDEDRSQVRKGHGPQVLASLRNFIIGLLRRLITNVRTSLASALRHFASLPERALSLFIGK